MANKPFLDIPESDYQSDEPVPNPVVIELTFNDPIVQEPEGKRTWTNYLYGVEYNGAEYMFSTTSKTVHESIQALGGTKGTQVKLIKKRIGPAQKDIRWSITYAGGPVDQDKIDSYEQAKNLGADTGSSKPPATPPAAELVKEVRRTVNVYMPLRDDPAYMDLAEELARDKLAVWNTIYELVANDYPDETSEWQATRATHISIGIERDIYHKVKDGYVTLDHVDAATQVPVDTGEDEEDPDIADYTARERAIYEADGRSFGRIVADNHDGIENGGVATDTIKKFGFTGLPKGDRRQWVDMARIIWRYADRKTQGMDEYYAMTATADEFTIPYEQLVDLPPAPNGDDENGIPF